MFFRAHVLHKTCGVYQLLHFGESRRCRPSRFHHRLSSSTRRIVRTPRGCLCSRLLWSGGLHLLLPPSQIKSLCPYTLLFRRAPAPYKRDFHDRVFHKVAHSRRLRVHRVEVILHLVHKPPQAEECHLLPCHKQHRTHAACTGGGKLLSHILRGKRVSAGLAAGRGNEKMRGGCGASREG